MPQFLSGQLSLTEKQTGSSRKQGKRWLFLHQYFFHRKIAACHRTRSSQRSQIQQHRRICRRLSLPFHEHPPPAHHPACCNCCNNGLMAAFTTRPAASRNFLPHGTCTAPAEAVTSQPANKPCISDWAPAHKSIRSPLTGPMAPAKSSQAAVPTKS
jgi:hypothetical protein